MLVLKHILGGSLKITSENSNNLARQKIASKESLATLFFWGFLALWLTRAVTNQARKGGSGSKRRPQ